MSIRYRTLQLALIAAGSLTAGCSLYQDLKNLVHSSEKLVKSAEKKVEKVGTPEKPAPSEETEPAREGPLLDNKVTALRVKEALARAGDGFGQVEVKGDAAAVTMTGTVASEALKKRAEEIARSVHREMTLKNELQIAR